MFETFFPDEYVDSTYVIPFEELYEKGYRGVIFDIDNTLVPHGAPADDRAVRFFERLEKIGFSPVSFQTTGKQECACSTGRSGQTIYTMRISLL